MALDKANMLNNTYALGRPKKEKNFVVGMWVNQDLWTTDGKNKLICNFKDMVQWKYFLESKEYVSEVELKTGDRVKEEDEDGIENWFYVIHKIAENDGKFKYLIGI